jgi:hypothetical protein
MALAKPTEVIEGSRLVFGGVCQRRSREEEEEEKKKKKERKKKERKLPLTSIIYTVKV